MADTPDVQYTLSDYTIACICPMGLEVAPVEAMLDEIHDHVPIVRDHNAYTFGKIGKHCVVIAVSPEKGTNVAANVATQILNDFPMLRFGLLVGIGGGVPGEVDVRLGDVVVSQATGTFGGVVQYDFGKKVEGGHFERTGMLNKPPQVLNAHVRKLDSRHRREGNHLSQLISDMIQRWPKMRTEYMFPESAQDNLFLTSYPHQPGNGCDRCDRKQIMTRSSRTSNEPHIHYGIIGSANVEVHDARMRDQLQQDMGVICVEMEAAGLMDTFPCVVIRGICDYADSHKNKHWRSYAAAVAAAYMKELLLTIPAHQVTQAKSVNKYFEVSQHLSPVFTGHEEICQHLETSLTSNTNPPASVQRRSVLFGLGGSGKTQICLWYAQTHRQRYWGVFWIDASTADSIQQSMERIALLIGTVSDIDNVKRALARAPQAWLLIFDNADDPSLSLGKYFPPGDRGDVIVTSRNPASSQYNTVGSHEVGPMSPMSSLALLYKIVYGRDSHAEVASDHGERVVETLGHLALAVTQAGAYIREMSCTFDHYLELYQRRRQEALDYRPQHLSTDYDHTVYTTWSVSVKQIRSMRSTVSVCALNILKLLSCYHYDQIPLSLFEHAWRNSLKDEHVPNWALWPQSTSSDFDLRHSVQLSMALLMSFSLITRANNASISMHPLVREWCQNDLNSSAFGSSFRHAVSLLATSITWDFESKHYQYRRSLTSHVQACVRLHKLLESDISDQDDALNWRRLTLVLTENGFAKDAVTMMEKVVQFYKSYIGENHPETLEALCFLATNYGRLGQQAKALQLTEHVAKLQKSTLGENHPDTLVTMHSLVYAYCRAGKHDDAFQLTQQLVNLQRNQLSRGDIDTISLMHTLANRYGEARKYRHAIRLLEQVVQLRKSKLGDDHPDTLASMQSLANRYGDVGDQDEALQLTETVYQISKAQLGDDHPGTLISMQSLANRYGVIGRQDEALQLSERAYRLANAKLGDDHPDTLRMMSDLASRYGDSSRHQEALQLGERALRLQRSKLGEDHPDTLISMYNLAIGYCESGRPDEALNMSELVLRLREDKLGKDHRDTMESRYLSERIMSGKVTTQLRIEAAP